ncbi:desumoylating isopeptidase 1 [Nematocida major]|uniref:desumoylating isopeptidase 1 n=1 Tax=Nematocida major TaxID=1912982 RepID=UPI002008B07C|nr:desumoylating isopeptidase 1 [Nematocida major]KAH9386045.1 desumoylating isopeptidase 1 [Nematocida major]
MVSVELWVYNIGSDAVVNIINQFLQTNIQGIWHTSLVVFDKEYYFMSGVQQGPPGTSPFGTPVQKIEFGSTEMTEECFAAFLQEINSLYTEKTYHIIRNNCNHFSNALLKRLVDREIPQYIMEASKLFENTPFEQMLSGMSPGAK